MRRSYAVLRLVLCLAIAAVPVGSLQLTAAAWGAQPQAVEEEGPTRPQIVNLLKGLEDQDLAETPEEIEALRAAYERTLKFIDARVASAARIEQFEADAAVAATEVEAIRARLDAGIEEADLDLVGKSLSELETLTDAAKLKANEARLTVEGLEVDESNGADRRAQIADELVEIESQRTELDRQLRAGQAVADEDALATALRYQLESEQAQLIKRAEELRVEQSTFAARRDLRVERLELAQQESEATAGVLSALQSALNAARQEEAEAQRLEAVRQVEEAAMRGPLFEARGNEIVGYREETLRLAGELEGAARRIAELKQRQFDLKRRFAQTKRRISIAGLSKDTGLHLRRERQRLLEGRTTRQELAEAQEAATEIELELFEVESRATDVARDDTFVRDLVLAAAAEGQIGDEIEALAVRTRQELRAALDALKEMLFDRSQQLLEIARLRGEIVREQQRYEDFVAERILWIRSSEPLWSVSGTSIKEELKQLTSITTLPDAERGVRDEIAARPFTIMLVLLALVALLAARLRVSKALAEEGELANLRSQVSIVPTLRATALSFIVAAPYGAVLYAISCVAETSHSDSDIARALADACSRAAAAAIIIGVLRALTARNGLQESHFGAEPDAVRLVRYQTNWLLPVMPTAALIGEFMASVDAGSTADALARIAFLVEVGSLLVFTWRVLSPKRGVLAINARSGDATDFLTRLRRLWFVLAVTVLSFLAILAIVGFGFTARSLFNRFELTVGLVLILVTIRSIALRWIKLIRRREAMEKLRKKREELREKRLAEIERRRSAGEDLGELESEGLEVEEEEVNLASISTDLKSLIRVVTVTAALGGAYGIWSSALPALGAFDRVKLWSHEVLVKGKDGGMEAALEDVTLANVGLALLILLITWRAVRDLPSLLEIILLRRLKMGSGERYAITTLLRYVLITVGVLLAFDKFGLAWSQLQWLVAGISVGLGFGLQEIFANFVSGITLLFERPVRVGDWVTLGEIEGVVSKIRIRATTIRDRDLKELIVPNREFITGRFINWTLSDPVSRVTASVGIAYGSDTEKAIQLLLDAGRDCPFSVSEPAPNVVFKSFGASSLDLELRVFVQGREIKPRVLHDLHLRIDAAFRTADIEISFPQRDLHIRTAPGLEELERSLEAKNKAGRQHP